jgi:hypothetical protein
MASHQQAFSYVSIFKSPFCGNKWLHSGLATGFSPVLISIASFEVVGVKTT